MRNRVNAYINALEKGKLAKYHDYQDVKHGRMKNAEYRKKWG